MAACSSVFAIALSGCAHFTIPAPNLPVMPLPETAIEDSIITLPVTISLDAVMNDLGLSSSNGKDSTKNSQALIADKLRRFLRRQASRKDNQIVQNIYARQVAGKAWAGLQNPIKLRNDLSLLLNPRAVSISPLIEDGENVQFVIGLVAKPRLIAGAVPPAKPEPFPSLSTAVTQTVSGFHLAIQTDLSYDYLGQELTGRLKGKAFSARGESVTIEKAKMYGSGESLVIALSIKGSVKGVLYLSGIPMYDPSAKSLHLKNLSYTLETRNVLAQAADWMLHAGLQESLEKRAAWPIGERIDSAKEILSAALNRDLSKQLSVTGKIEDVRPVSVGITDSGVRAVLEADGTVEMQMLNH